MGFSIHWQRPREFGKAGFDLFLAEAGRILEHAKGDGYHVAGEDGLGVPEVSPVALTFNGARGQGGSCEAFHLPRIMEERDCRRPSESGLFWRHCKTEFLPYGAVAIAVLLSLRHHFPEVSVETDKGDVSAAEEGAKLYVASTGRTP